MIFACRYLGRFLAVPVMLLPGCQPAAPAPSPTTKPEPFPIFDKGADAEARAKAEAALAERLRSEVQGLHDIRAAGNITDDEYYKGVDRAIDALSRGSIEPNAAWLGRQLDVLSRMKVDGLLTPAEFEHARSILVERYEK